MLESGLPLLKDIIIQLNFPLQVQLRMAEPPSPTDTKSLPDKDVLQRSPMDLGDADLATQCVDSTLLSLDSSSGHLEDDTVPDPTMSSNYAQVAEQAPDINAQTHAFGDNFKQDVQGKSKSLASVGYSRPWLSMG